MWPYINNLNTVREWYKNQRTPIPGAVNSDVGVVNYSKDVGLSLSVHT